ncbi:MAG TPA: mannosyltransferase family protein [Anaerolineales bacterium]|nr:mannosyltransferase family protein [Anaerolineales bacterium]
MASRSIRNLILLWIAWILIVLGFQAWTVMRFQITHPDYALEWTPIDTARTYKLKKPYLNEPFMNQQVAFDSEYYLSIATVGYDDPKVSSGDINGQRLPLNYAYLPFYPYVMRGLSFPLRILGLNPIATSTLAGVIVSVLGAFGGLLALFDLARDELGEAGAWRAAFYLLIFPAGFFLAMVYTEGLFVGLTFGSLASMKRQKWLWAASLAVCATLTRAVGVALVIPLMVAYFRLGQWREMRLSRPSLKLLALGLLTLAPLLAYIVWRLSPLGKLFQIVDEGYFGRQLLDLGGSFDGWVGAIKVLSGSHLQTAAYYMVEIGATLLSIVACIFTWKHYPEVTLFSLAVILISLTSGVPQGMHRYVMTAPAVFLFLGQMGKQPAFDRAWTILSTLLMGGLALLFAADMWAG